ncbi:MAG: nucleotidyltransferase family protein [Bryobacteraceae bacterium]|jgi:hypothetical protein
MLSETQRELVHLLRADAAQEYGGDARERLWQAALDEEVAVPLATKLGPTDEAYLLEQQLQHQTRLHWLEKILRRLEAASVGVVNLKGPVFGERFYRPPYGRPSLDLDLALARNEVPAAVRELERLGYRSEPILFVPMDQHAVLLHDFAPEVELHYRLLSEFGVRQEMTGFLARARTVEVPGLGTVRVPDAEDEFLFLCAHAAKHRFSKLRWMYDLFLLLGSSSLDGDAVWRRAGEMHARSLLALSVVVLEREWGLRVSGIPIPASRLARAARILPEFTKVRPPARTKAQLANRYARDMAACDDLRGRLRCCWRLGASFSQRAAKEAIGRFARVR